MLFYDTGEEEEEPSEGALSIHGNSMMKLPRFMKFPLMMDGLPCYCRPSLKGAQFKMSSGSGEILFIDLFSASKVELTDFMVCHALKLSEKHREDTEISLQFFFFYYYYYLQLPLRIVSPSSPRSVYDDALCACPGKLRGCVIWDEETAQRLKNG